METYKKTYKVDNALITYEAWERHQTQGWRERFGRGAPPSIFDAYGGVADVYYQDAVFLTFREVEAAEHAKEPQFYFGAMDHYEAVLDVIQAAIAQGKPFSDAKALKSFLRQFEDAWIGLDLSYMPYSIALDASAERRSVAAREKAFGFYVGADRLIRLTLESWFPDLGALTKYLTLHEATDGGVPDRVTLEERSQHFIYFKGQVLTGMTFAQFCRQEWIRIESVYLPLLEHLRGQVASGGTASGPARVLAPESDRGLVKEGEILVARDLSFGDLGLVKRVLALVLDEESYYAPAAIAARAQGKPCVFATKNATMTLRDGDVLAVDGNAGIVLTSPPARG